MRIHNLGPLTHALLIAILILGFMAAPNLSGQSTTQAIQGLVTDATGAVVAGATIAITHVATGVQTMTTTNETGNFSFQIVPVGDYEVTCTLEGFKTETVPNFRLATADQRRQDFALELGDISETIEVVASAVGLQTENATVGGVVENARITELPLNGRNMVQLAVLVPGVQFGQRSGLANGLGGRNRGQVYAISANGIREMHQVVTLDGVDAKEPRGNNTLFVPSIEAIEEFKVQTNAYSAEAGFGGGAVTTITMKSGTNDLHGTLFHFLRNDKLDAEDYFLNFERVGEREPKDKLRRNQFGLVVSGPIIKNKTFWSFNWEARRERVGRVRETWFPLDEFRNGDFSELLTDSFLDTGRQSPVLLFDATTGDPFPNNVIPSSRIHPGSKNLLDQFIPRAQFREADPLRETARRAVDDATDGNQFFGRVDHHLGNADRVFGRLAWDEGRREAGDINPNFSAFTDPRTANVAASWVHTVNQNAINDLRFGFSAVDADFVNPRTHDENFDMDALGIGKIRVAGDGNRELIPLEVGVPKFSGLPFRLTDSGPVIESSRTIQLADHLSIMKGSHNLKFGGEYYHLSLDVGGSNLPRGNFNFGSNESGLAFASYLLGLPSRTTTSEGSPFSLPRANRFAVYAQDDWKVSPKWTVNLGFRFDYVGNPVSEEGAWRTVNFCGEELPQGRGPGCFTDPATGNQYPTIGPEFVDERGSVKLWKQRYRFFMPRIGIAYRPSERWVVRLGAGYFDNVMHLNNFTILSLMPPKSGTTSFNSVTDRAQTVTLTTPGGRTFDNLQTRVFRPGSDVISLDDPFLTESGVTAAARPVNTLHLKPDYKNGEVWKWSFDVQRELPRNIAFTVGYVGSKGGHTANSIRNWNSPEPNPDTDIQGNRPFQRVYDLAQPEKGVQSLGVVRYLDSYVNSFHHGLQAKLDKRYANGLAFRSRLHLQQVAWGRRSRGQRGGSIPGSAQRSPKRPRPLPLRPAAQLCRSLRLGTPRREP